MSRRLPAQVDAIRFLVQAGCPASVQDNVASTPLHIAAGEGHIEAIRVLKSLVITFAASINPAGLPELHAREAVCKFQRYKLPLMCHADLSDNVHACSLMQSQRPSISFLHTGLRAGCEGQG